MHNPGMVETFKQLGFYTLAEELGFSEEYDSVEDNEKRMKMIQKKLLNYAKYHYWICMNVG